ncbi:ferritin-like domain-containing protein [Actinoplanes regularis]|uniref:Ferritin-like n=1 Tax=Actinoplanes regularis TaxID=52697 RepID=A0A239DWE3_9ACTN|nr:ferritin-like domain-containing protein [Actinoplanes regularis]SNS36826.1 Ferritin-like [Actinoplanes regularis]
MSVLDLPRLHFRGTATTKLPTGPRSGLIDLATNRALTDDGPVPTGLPPAEYHAWLERRGEGPLNSGKGYNFGGSGHFWIDAEVVAAEAATGPDRDDPVIGRRVDLWGHYNEYLATTANRARVFDLDPTSRWTTTVMVGQFALGRGERSYEDGYLISGEVSGFQPPRWHHFDYCRELREHPLATELARSTVHQFVLASGEGLRWLPGTAESPAVARLRDVAAQPGVDGLVVQFALATMAAPVAPDAPNQWLVRGTVAPWRRTEPRTCPAGRLLTPRAAGWTRRPVPLHNLTVAVEPDRVTFNLVTAVPVTGRGGDRVRLGDLELRSARTSQLIARVPGTAYTGPDFDLLSGIVTVPNLLAGALPDEALCLVGEVAGERRPLVAEEEVTVQTDDGCLVLEHPDRSRGDDHAVTVAIRSFVRGRPAPVDGIRVRQFLNPRSRPLDPVVAAPSARCGDVDLVRVAAPGGDFAASCVVDTDDRGDGRFTIRGACAGTARILLAPDGDPGPCPPEEPGSSARAYDDADALGYWSGAGQLAVRVLPDDWSLDAVPVEEVTFDLLYHEVLADYEFLYSFMNDEVFSLADRCKVATYARLLWQMSDPANRSRTWAMPPTRDMSAAKAGLFLKFLRREQSAAKIPVAASGQVRPGLPITTRGQLLVALRQAVTLELAVMLQYLYAAYSVPTHAAAQEFVRRGRWTPEQARLACGDGGRSRDGGVRGRLIEVAREEMIHFLAINNIIMALGEGFHVPVFSFGTLNGLLPVAMDFALEPLAVGSLQRFIAIERPLGAVSPLAGVPGPDLPPGRDEHRYHSIPELYDGIREGLRRVPDLFMIARGRGGGEHHLFLRESINAVHPDYQLYVDDLASALFAIDVVTEQGEGGRLHADAGGGESHYEIFLGLADVLLSERTSRELWTPAYPVARNPARHPGNPNTEPVTDPEAIAVLDLFNRAYFMMIQLMVQHFGQDPDASLRRSKLMNAAIDVMTGMMGPLAEVLVTMSSGRPGTSAGPSFELEAEPRFIPRPDVAMRSMALRFDHLATASGKVAAAPERVTEMFAFYADRFGAGVRA